MEEEQDIKSRIKGFVRECGRVLKITKKPTMKEYKMIVMITGAGMLVIGLLGFTIAMINQLVF